MNWASEGKNLKKEVVYGDHRAKNILAKHHPLGNHNRYAFPGARGACHNHVWVQRAICGPSTRHNAPESMPMLGSDVQYVQYVQQRRPGRATWS